MPVRRIPNMKYPLLSSEFEDQKAILQIGGRTPNEAVDNARGLLRAIKLKDPTAFFSAPEYDGFSVSEGKHVVRLAVIFGPDSTLSADVIRSLV